MNIENASPSEIIAKINKDGLFMDMHGGIYRKFSKTKFNINIIMLTPQKFIEGFKRLETKIGHSIFK